MLLKIQIRFLSFFYLFSVPFCLSFVQFIRRHLSKFLLAIFIHNHHHHHRQQALTLMESTATKREEESSADFIDKNGNVNQILAIFRMKWKESHFIHPFLLLMLLSFLYGTFGANVICILSYSYFQFHLSQSQKKEFSAHFPSSFCFLFIVLLACLFACLCVWWEDKVSLHFV